MFLMDLQVCFGLLWVCFNSLTFSATSKSTPDSKIWFVDSTFNDKIVPINNIDPNSFLTASSRRLCAVTCAQRSWCNSFFYKKSTAECYLHSRVFENLADAVGDLGVRYYKPVEEKKPGCPSSLGYRLIRGQCAKLYMDAMTPEEARSQCEDDGGHLYYFTDLTTDEPVITELPNVIRGVDARYRVGADRLSTSDYQWHDGSHLSDSDPLWRQSYPTRGNNKCVALRTYYMRLQDYPCDLMMYFICQIDV